MFIKITINLLWLLLLFLLPFSSASAADYTVFTNVMPPIKMFEHGRIHGIAGDVLITLMKRVGHPLSPQNMHLVSWKDAYQRTQTTPHTICLAMAKTLKRTPHFKWVGPVYTTELGLIAKTKNTIHIENLEEAKQYTIGTFAKSAMDEIMVANGIPSGSIVRSRTIKEAVQLLVDDKITLLAFTKSPTYYILQKQGINPSQYEMVLDVRSADLYFAFNPSADDTMLARLQKELDAMKKPGPDGYSEYDRIVLDYFKAIP